jgi:hypothetical protein
LERGMKRRRWRGRKDCTIDRKSLWDNQKSITEGVGSFQQFYMFLRSVNFGFQMLDFFRSTFHVEKILVSELPAPKRRKKGKEEERVWIPTLDVIQDFFRFQKLFLKLLRLFDVMFDLLKLSSERGFFL